MERVFRFFPREQVQVIKFDDFRKNTAGGGERSLRFSRGGPLTKVKNRQQNRIPYERKITPEERQFLYKAYREISHGSKQLLGWDCSDWKEKGS